jgi:hypothetical protein
MEFHEKACHMRSQSLYSHNLASKMHHNITNKKNLQSIYSVGQFCHPAQGNEKTDARGTVKAVQWRFATPVPPLADQGELNVHFQRRGEAELQRTLQPMASTFVIRDRLAKDLAAAEHLPARRFDACVIQW